MCSSLSTRGRTIPQNQTEPMLLSHLIFRLSMILLFVGSHMGGVTLGLTGSDRVANNRATSDIWLSNTATQGCTEKKTSLVGRAPN